MTLYITSFIILHCKYDSVSFEIQRGQKIVRISNDTAATFQVQISQ